MARFKECLRACPAPASLLADERGLSTVEYVILLVLIAIASLTVWSSLGQDIRTQLKNADSSFVKTVHS